MINNLKWRRCGQNNLIHSNIRLRGSKNIYFLIVFYLLFYCLLFLELFYVVKWVKILAGKVQHFFLALSPAFGLKNGNLMLTLLSVTINHPLIHNTHRCLTPCHCELSHSWWMKQALICHFSYEWMLALGRLFQFFLLKKSSK